MLLAGLLARATAPERQFLVRLLAGELRQGALDGVMTDAIARAAGVPAAAVRRAYQLSGSLPAAATAALGRTGPAAADRAEAAAAALAAVTLQVGRPVGPMLAASAPTVAAALERISPAAVDWKIDGIRVQLHRHGSHVRVFSRTLDDITARVPEIAAAALDAARRHGRAGRRGRRAAAGRAAAPIPGHLGQGGQPAAIRQPAPAAQRRRSCR